MMMKGQYKIGLARIILLLLLILHHKISAATISSTINTLPYSDSIINNKSQIISQTSYYDGTILLRLSYPSTSLTTTNCNEPNLFLRLILLDGSIKELNIDAQIPLENFCNNNNQLSLTTNLENDYIKFYAISPDLIFVTYYCDLSHNFNLCGMVINWNGVILNNNYLGDSCTDSYIIQSIETGFLWSCYSQASNQLKWQKFSSPDASGSYYSLGSGIINDFYNFNSKFTKLFATEDGGYGIVNTQNQDSQMYVMYVTFISSNSNDLKGPFQIYLQTTENLQQLEIFKCNIAYYSFGYNCIVYLVETNGQRNFVNIEFLSSGSVSNISRFNINNDLISIDNNIWNVLQLYYGGLCILTENILNKNIHGLIFTNNGSYYKNWDISNNYFNLTKNVGIFTNNTIWVISKLDLSNDWTLVSSSFLSDYNKSGGYNNFYVDSTIPQINSTIPLMSTQKLQITFKNIIQLSNGNLSIIDPNNIIRQSVNKNNGNFINIINNDTVEIDVFESTFNRKDTLYYVLVDNGFVKDARVGQELLGIKKGIWEFTTDNNLEETPYLKESFLGSTSAILRLTSSGTKYYTSLSQNEKDQFSRDLASNLSLIIPCNDHLFIRSRYQFDKDTSPNQILLRIYIKKEGRENVDVDNVSSSQIVKDLDLLIRNQDYNAMSTIYTTSLLDASYGAKSLSNLWVKYGFILIGVLVGFMILISLYYCSRKGNNKAKANNEVIFTFTFVMVDFLLDVSFVSIHGHDLSWLYPTSIVILIIPIILNLIFTYIIISKEIKDNNKFTKWWMKNSKIALLFTLLAGIDLESLKCVSSKCFGSTKLSAPLTKRTEYYILIVNIITIFIEDISQFIILSLYQAYTIVPDIIPIITLASCMLVLLTRSIFSIIYCHQYRKSNISTEITKKQFKKKPDTLNIFNGKSSYDKNDNFPNISPILPPLTEDSRRKPKKSFFGSVQNSVDSKRNSNSSIQYGIEALRLFSSGSDISNNNNNNNNNSSSSNDNSHSDLAERIIALNEKNYIGRNETTGEPIFLLRDPEDYNGVPSKIKQLSHSKLVGDSIVSVGKSITDKLSGNNNNQGKRLSNVGIICNTEGDDEKEEILMNQEIDNNTQTTGSDESNRSSTINRSRSSRSTQTNTTNTSDGSMDNDHHNNTLKAKISSVSLNQQNNLGTITEKSSNVDSIDNNNDDDDDDDDDANDENDENDEEEKMITTEN
ncbi:hypothetical protein C1645_792908 [Glomus cerebriforme]|uniref:SbsA Ig-like domain-containing protein n=1 Tax=Glomus cerebriforme TaxID=658196 RepID=A0A397S6C7_9GLOM|nr:hypothetical protein C1645_792908 [Glomus cerebriforme]